MAIEKRTILDQIEISVRTGIVSARFVKQLVEDGRVLHEEYHRARVAPGRDVDVEMAAVNLHLRAMGQAEVQDYEPLKDHVAVAHTSRNIGAFAGLAQPGMMEFVNAPEGKKE